MMAMNSKIPQQEPSEIEALLPWHAAGTLGARDSRRVEEALARDPALARQYATIQEECAETIALNESLGAPSARAMHKLFAAIDAEPARKPSVSLNVVRISGFLARLAPRTLAFSAAAAALLLLLQAGAIGALLASFGAASYPPASLSSPQQGRQSPPHVLVRFVPDARISDITAFLETNRASIIGSAGGGLFRLQVSDRAVTPQDTAALVSRLQSEKIVSLAAPAQ